MKEQDDQISLGGGEEPFCNVFPPSHLAHIDTFALKSNNSYLFYLLIPF